MEKLDDEKRNGQITNKSTGTNIKSNLVLKKTAKITIKEILVSHAKKECLCIKICVSVISGMINTPPFPAMSILLLTLERSFHLYSIYIAIQNRRNDLSTVSKEILTEFKNTKSRGKLSILYFL